MATTAADTDFTVRLTDVAPDGRHLLVGEGIRRPKLRETFARPQPVVPGERYALTIELVNDLAHAFPVGQWIASIKAVLVPAGVRLIRWL